jgi:hypothetical protein
MYEEIYLTRYYWINKDDLNGAVVHDTITTPRGYCAALCLRMLYNYTWSNNTDIHNNKYMFSISEHGCPTAARKVVKFHGWRCSRNCSQISLFVRESETLGLSYI